MTHRLCGYYSMGARREHCRNPNCDNIWCTNNSLFGAPTTLMSCTLVCLFCSSDQTVLAANARTPAHNPWSKDAPTQSMEQGRPSARTCLPMATHSQWVPALGASAANTTLVICIIVIFSILLNNISTCHECYGRLHCAHNNEPCVSCAHGASNWRIGVSGLWTAQLRRTHATV